MSVTRAALWWAVMYAAMLTFNGLLRMLTGVPMPTLAHAYALPIFGVLTAALVIASWRRREPGRT